MDRISSLRAWALALIALAIAGVAAWLIETWAHHQPGPWPEALQVVAAVALLVVTYLYVRRTAEYVQSTRQLVDLQREEMDATLQLVKAQRAQTEATLALLELQRGQVEASLRPVVVPAPPGDWIEMESDAKSLRTQDPARRADAPENAWADTLPIKNVGPGIAFNVRAHLENLGEPAGVIVDSVTANLGSGDREELQLNWAGKAGRVVHWDTARGWLDFEDVAGGRWRGRFQFRREGKRLHLQVLAPQLVMAPDGTPTGLGT